MKQTTQLLAAATALMFAASCQSQPSDTLPKAVAAPVKTVALENPTGETIAAPDGYQLVWSDEFNTDGRPDPTKWKPVTGFIRNNERQWYQPQNAMVENGHLIIEGRREERPNPHYKAGSKDWKTNRPSIEYTSACLITRGLHSWTRGIFEMRGRIPTGPGLWPAWWTVGDTSEGRKWPANGEIDILESFRGSLHANLFYAGKPGGKMLMVGENKDISSFNDPQWGDKFHVWRMDWDEKTIKLSVDGVLLNEVDISNTFNVSADGANPFTEPQSMLLNLAIGGGQGGGKEVLPDGSSAGEKLPGGDYTKSTYPQRMEVDYVRVFQKPEDIAAAQ